jgi:hypothetical protein
MTVLQIVILVLIPELERVRMQDAQYWLSTLSGLCAFFDRLRANCGQEFHITVRPASFKFVVLPKTDDADIPPGGQSAGARKQLKRLQELSSARAVGFF